MARTKGAKNKQVVGGSSTDKLNQQFRNSIEAISAAETGNTSPTRLAALPFNRATRQSLMDDLLCKQRRVDQLYREEETLAVQRRQLQDEIYSINSQLFGE